MVNIRICTWNVGGGLIRSDRNVFEIEDYGYFRSALIEIGADIVCVQESHSGMDCSEDQLALLAAALGLPHVVSQVLSQSHLKPATNSSIGVATRLRVLKRDFLKLPNPNWTGRGPDGTEWVTFDKGFLSLVLEVDGRSICLVTGHDFPFRAFARSEEDPELLEMHDSLNALLKRRAADLPTLFTGDLNIEQPSRCLPVLQAPVFHRVIPSGPTTQPWQMQFDHIYGSGDFQVRASGVIPGEADHLLCWADLQLDA